MSPDIARIRRTGLGAPVVAAADDEWRVAPRLGVVLVNWRRAADTLECLESVLRSDIPLHVVVVDNASGDGSIEAIVLWGDGDEAAPVAAPAMARLDDPAAEQAAPRPSPDRSRSGDRHAR